MSQSRYLETLLEAIANMIALDKLMIAQSQDILIYLWIILSKCIEEIVQDFPIPNLCQKSNKALEVSAKKADRKTITEILISNNPSHRGQATQVAAHRSDPTNSKIKFSNKRRAIS